MINKELLIKPRPVTKKVTIYALKDPRTNEIRYVGKTVKKDLNKRLIEHCSYKNKTHKYFWILQLKNENLKPIIEAVEKCTDNDWQEREIYWIQYYKDLNCKLTNSHEGGMGGHNPSAETRAKLSAAAKGRIVSEETKIKMRKPKSEEHKAKLIAAQIGRVCTQETREKIGKGNRGKTLSEETREKIAKASLGRLHTKETKLKMSQVQKGEKNAMYGKTHSEETKQKLSIISSNRRHTEETKLKIAQGNKGKIVTEETRIKMSIAAKNKKKRITEEHITAILLDDRSHVKIAETFNIHSSTISRIKNGKYKKSNI